MIINNGKEFGDELKKLGQLYDIIIWWSVIEEQTNNRIMPYRRSGMKYGIHGKNKTYKISYKNNKAGNQLYFWDRMFSKIKSNVTYDIGLKTNN